MPSRPSLGAHHHKAVAATAPGHGSDVDVADVHAGVGAADLVSHDEIDTGYEVYFKPS